MPPETSSGQALQAQHDNRIERFGAVRAELFLNRSSIGQLQVEASVDHALLGEAICFVFFFGVVVRDFDVL